MAFKSVRVAVAAALLLGGIAGPALAQEKKPVKIGAILALSGAGALDGQEARHGMQAMADIVNAEGGVAGGRKIELVFYDDKNTPEDAISAAKRAIEGDKVDLLVGTIISPTSLAIKDVSRDKMVHIVLLGAHPNITLQGHKWLFRLNATVPALAQAYAKHICEKAKPASVAFLTVNDDFGRFDNNNMKKLLGDCKIAESGSEFFNRQDADYSTVLTKLRATSPAAFYVSATATSQAANVLRQLRQIGYRGPVFLSVGVLSPKTVELAGPGAEGALGISLYTFQADETNPISVKWHQNYQGLAKTPPSVASVAAGEAVEVLARAVDKVGDANKYDEIATEIKTRKWKTIMGDTTFDQIGQALRPIHIMQVRGGKFFPVN